MGHPPGDRPLPRVGTHHRVCIQQFPHGHDAGFGRLRAGHPLPQAGPAGGERHRLVPGGSRPACYPRPGPLLTHPQSVGQGIPGVLGVPQLWTGAARSAPDRVGGIPPRGCKRRSAWIGHRDHWRRLHLRQPGVGVRAEAAK